MAITSNIDQVIGQMQRLKARVPAAVARVNEPLAWRERAREVAEGVLKSLAVGEEQQGQVARFVDAVTSGALGGRGFTLGLDNPVRPALDLIRSARSARLATGAADLGLGLFNLPLQKFEDAILDWVQTEKHKDARDEGKTDEDIAHLISYILLAPNLGERGRQAREGLLPHILEFLDRQRGPLPRATVDQWLRAVLAAWRAMVRTELVQRLRAELRAGRS